MPNLIQQWRGYSPRERFQYLLECWGAVSISSLLFVVALTFAASPRSAVMLRIGGTQTAYALALNALAGALLAPALVPLRTRLSLWWKRRAYAFLAVSVLFYALAVFFFVRDYGNVSAGVIVYLMFYNLLVLVGVAVYRDA